MDFLLWPWNLLTYGLPPIIDTEINLRKSKSNALKSAMEIGMYLVNDRRLIKRAYKKAVENYENFKAEVRKGALPGDIIDKNRSIYAVKPGEILNIAVIGHPYNLYDSYMNMDLLKKLKNEGVNITTVEMIDESAINEKSGMLNKKIFWNFGRKAIGGAMHLLDRNDMDGIIYVMSFGCGIDAFVCDLIERKIRRNGDMPFTVLTIDEHSGTAGINTRLEAFIDMIRWRRNNENNLSTYG